MKKILERIKGLIVKYRKRLVYGLFALFLGQIAFFGLGGVGFQNNVLAVEAQNTQATQNQEFGKKITEKLGFVDFVRKFIYALAYPVIFLAAKLVDNSFVYGEIFGLDTVLWKLRNIIKNFANFTLGFIFVYKIFAYLINVKNSNSKENPKQIITKALVAGIGIQASWFIMGVLIDISTLLIYGIGGLPISILNSIDDAPSDTSKASNNYNPYMLKTVVSVDVNDLDNLNIYQTNIGRDPGDFYISECDTVSVKHTGGATETFLLAPKMIYYQDLKGQYYKTEQNKCHYFGMVYRFNGLDVEDGIKWESCSDATTCKDAQGRYEGSKKNARENILGTGKNIKGLVDGAKILEIGNAHMEGGIAGGVNVGARIYGENEQYGLDVDNNRLGTSEYGEKMKKLSEVLQDEEETNTYVGVFTSLYASLLQVGNGIVADNNASVYVRFLNALLALCHLGAIIIPLAISAIVFMFRIGIIWIAIILSPMIALFTAFGLFDKIKSIKFLEYFKISNLIPIIFSPAIICFAISMSTVLVTIITKINYSDIETNEERILGGLIKMDIAGFSIGVGKLIISVIGIAITWFLVWAAINVSKLGQLDIIKNMKTLAQSAMGSVGVVPIPTKDGGVNLIGANTAFGLNGNESLLSKVSNDIKTQYRKEDNEAINSLLGNFSGSSSSDKDEKDKSSNQIFQQYWNGLSKGTITGDWTTQGFDIGNGQTRKFSELNASQQEQVIENINKLSKNDAMKYKTPTGSITIGEKKYTFNEQTAKYESSSTPAS